ncbi:MAG: hypothetical protein AB1921_07585, partial [Thermodesulfobacteriota bacterium]
MTNTPAPYEVTVFFARQEPVLAPWAGLLSPEEEKRCARLVSAEKRGLCVLSKGLCRRALSLASGVP